MLKYMKVTLVTLIAIALLTACSYSSEGDQSSTSASDSGSGQAQKGGKVTIPIVADPTFNPWSPNAFAESNVVNRVLFDGLTKPGKDLQPSPDLATSWETSNDGLVWTFHLRKGVKWHDGKPFTADDVAYTFNDIALKKSLGANNASYFKSVKNVEVVDDHTVKFNLSSPFAALPAYLSYNTEILPKHIFEGKDPWNLTSFNKKNPVGTGPFKIKSYTSGQSVVLERNDDYWGDKAKLDEVEYKVLPDANTQIAQLLSGELSIFALSDLSSIDMLKNSPKVDVAGKDIPDFYWVIVNQKEKKYQDQRVRQAFEYAIDRKNIIKTVLKGYGKVANAAISPALSQYYTDDVKQYNYDPKKAKELLAEAGWKDTNGDGIVDKDGKPFTVNFEIGLQGNLKAIAQLVQQYLKIVGIDVKLKTMDWNSMIDKVVIQRDYDMTLNWWKYAADPDLSAYMHTGGGNNIPAFSNKELDELLEAGAQTSDVDKRKQIYNDAQKVMSEQLPYLFLFYPEEVLVKQKTLKGVPDLDYSDTLYYINEWYLKK
ncbi:peptide-binding protein [Pullulanibacillus camelliae]|uniref:Peptide-binding protein n=1 Tax=Pullulanibacillus camelliae TaxID=1707096 RepID=A0A8J2YDX3_9BACL|nr:ABC transporter substrate-binding protein [Pullulanibacillus camelliae]GGE27351.1 peptide-binding protein [Pullulanibacillus camelliae]